MNKQEHNNSQREIVTAALIEKDDSLLVCRRPVGGRLGGYWELPGGKVEPGEDPRDGLVRELYEELGVRARAGRPYEVVHHSYEFGDVLLLFFYADIIEGRPLPLHHDEVRWVQRTALPELQFLPADVPMIRRLAEGQ